MKKVRNIILLSTALALLLSLTSCGGGYDRGTENYNFQAVPTPSDYYNQPTTGGGGDYYESDMATDSVEPGEVTEDAATQEFDAVPEAGAGDLSGKKIITTYSIALETLEYEEFLSEIEKYVEDKQGYIEHMESWGKSPDDPILYSAAGESYGSGAGRYASMTVRIPETETEGFFAMLREGGNETSYSVSKSDISLEYYDTSARIKALETERDRLLELMENAEGVEELILLEQRIADVNYELDSKETQMRHYDNQIDYTSTFVTISEVIKFSEGDKFDPSFGERISAGFSNTIYGIKTGAEDLVVWLIVNSIVIIPVGIVLVLVVLFIRKRGHKLKQSVIVTPEKSAKK